MKVPNWVLINKKQEEIKKSIKEIERIDARIAHLHEARRNNANLIIEKQQEINLLKENETN